MWDGNLDTAAPFDADNAGRSGRTRDRQAGRAAWTQRARRAQAGQSAIIAVIVLFLLLFLGAAFVALIVSNLRSAQRAAITSASGRFADAGLQYADQQLTNSPEGADWRPTPFCLPNATCTTLSSSDPDYYWLQPYHYNAGSQQYVGGYTRVNYLRLLEHYSASPKDHFPRA